MRMLDIFPPSSQRTPGPKPARMQSGRRSTAMTDSWVLACAGMTTRVVMASLLVLSSLTATTALAQDVLIRNATVHTAGPQGTLQNADVLVQGGIVRTVGKGLQAPTSVSVVEDRKSVV